MLFISADSLPPYILPISTSLYIVQTKLYSNDISNSFAEILDTSTLASVQLVLSAWQHSGCVLSSIGPPLPLHSFPTYNHTTHEGRAVPRLPV